MFLMNCISSCIFNSSIKNLLLGIAQKYTSSLSDLSSLKVFLVKEKRVGRCFGYAKQNFVIDLMKNYSLLSHLFYFKSNSNFSWYWSLRECVRGIGLLLLISCKCRFFNVYNVFSILWTEHLDILKTRIKSK